jgi:hypothetical protein
MRSISMPILIVLDGISITKTLKVDLRSRMALSCGNIPETIKGGTVDAGGNIWVVNDSV